MPDPHAAVSSNKSPVLIDGELEVEPWVERAHEKLHGLTIAVLPEEMILEIFCFYKLSCRHFEWEWHKLAHVCRQWRTVIFASQQRLDLQLVCTPKTSIKQTSDLWPAFPIFVKHTWPLDDWDDWDNTIATLQERNRICEIDLDFLAVSAPRSAPQYIMVQKIVASMQKPFPILDRLSFTRSIGVECASSFLGGFAPRLRVLFLDAYQCTAFELPPILLSTNHLVDLRLQRICSTERIPSEALVTALSALVRLKTLYLQFMYETPHSNPWSHLPSSPGFVVSSTLLRLTFQGPCNYLEGLLSRISAPSLEWIDIKSLAPEPNFDASELSRFLCRIESQWPTEAAELKYGNIYLFHTRSVAPQPKRTEWSFELPYQTYHWVSQMSQICQKLSPILSNVRTLSIPMLNEPHQDPDRDRHWVDVLRVFNCVEELHVAEVYSSRIPHLLKLIQASDVLPALRQLSIDSGFINISMDAVTSFIDARKHAGLPAVTFQRLKVNRGRT